MEEIPKNQNYRFFFANWFSTIPLLLKLKSMGSISTATLRSNCVASCSLLSDKDLKTTEHGSFDYHIDLNSSLRVVKWFDNKRVGLGSSFSIMTASSTKKRSEKRAL